MEKTKLYTSQWYMVRSMDDHHGLAIHETNSLKQTKAQIDAAEQKVIERGYEPNKWLIVLNRSNTIYKTDMNGNDRRFHYRSTTQEAIGIYDDGIITFFDGREPMK